MIKDKIYNLLVRNNKNIQREYERYVMEHINEHNSNRLGHWKVLFKLNWHYRVKKESEPLIYPVTVALVEKEETAVKKSTPASKVALVSKKASVSKSTPKYLPYLGGAESRTGTWNNPVDLVRKLLAYDVISFDVFDTLVFRPFGKPRDLFHIVGGKLDLIDFFNLRSNAEDDLRQRRTLYGNSSEITIRDIYEELHRTTGIDIELGIRTEVETELEFIFANPYMKYIFETLQSNGKRILLITDMYLNSEMISKLLKKCGYVGYERLFVSCEYKSNKRSGELYQIVKAYLGSQLKWMHIGDNEVSDVQSAQAYGIDTHFYENVNKKGNTYRAIDMSLVVGSAYRGIVNAHLHNGFKRYDAYYEFGYLYGGLFTLGYANYIREFAKKNEIDKVLFVSRDGYLIKQIFEKAFADIDTEYIFWSRIVGLKLCSYKYKNDYLKEYVHRWIKEGKKVTFKDIFENMEITSLTDDFYKVTSLKMDDCLVAENLECFMFYIENIWDDILKIYEEKLIAAKKYVSEVLGNSKRVCVVDIGWRGQGALAIRSLVNEKWEMDCEVYGLVAATAPTKGNSIQLATGVLDAYMFSPGKNINCFKFHSKNAINNVLTELLVGAPHPSLRAINPKDGDYELIFEAPEVNNYAIIEAVHRGVNDFADEYLHHFGKYPFMLNISGNDAYMPIMHIFKDYRFLKRFFGKYEFQDCVGGTEKYQSRLIKEVFEKFNL